MFLRILSFLILTTSFHLNAQNKFHVVSIERTSCFGRCPAFILSVDENGNVFYEGIKDAMLHGIYQCDLSPKKVKRLFQKYQHRKLLPLLSNYTDKARDNAKLHVSIAFNNTRKMIRNAQAGPRFLQQLANDLDTLIAHEKPDWHKVNSTDSLTLLVEPPYPGKDSPVQQDDKTYDFVEQMPEFPGGNEELKNFIVQHLDYPRIALENSVSGKVIITFEVDVEGHIQAARVARGIGSGCDEEALRVVRSMPKWIPGMQNGKKVRVKLNIPIAFRLD